MRTKNDLINDKNNITLNYNLNKEDYYAKVLNKANIKSLRKNFPQFAKIYRSHYNEYGYRHQVALITRTGLCFLLHSTSNPNKSCNYEITRFNLNNYMIDSSIVFGNSIKKAIHKLLRYLNSNNLATK